METRAPVPRPQGQGSQDDDGLWMKMDLNPVISRTETTNSGPSETSGEGPQESKDTTPEVIPRYYGVMDDEGADCVFLRPFPPPSVACLVPAETDTGATVSNSSMTLTNEEGDATEAKSNPKGLHWHHGEKQVVAACNKVDEVLICAAQRECMATVSGSIHRDIFPPSDEHQISVEGTRTLMDSSGRDHGDDTQEKDLANEASEDTDSLSEGKEDWRGAEVEQNKYKKETTSDFEEIAYVRDLIAEKDLIKSKDSCDDEMMAHNVSRNDMKISAPIFGLHKCDQNESDATMHHSQRDDPTKYVSTRRDGGTSKTELSEMSVCEGLSKVSEQTDGSGKIATEIQHGEQLLQRLQLVQQRHDVHMPENVSASQHNVQDGRLKDEGLSLTELEDLTAKEKDLGDEKEECRFVNYKALETDLKEKEKNKKNESKGDETTTRMSSSMMPEQLAEHHRTAKTEAGCSYDDQSYSLGSSGVALVAAQEVAAKSIPLTFSAAETSMEKEIHEAVQGKQNLQRAGGVFNLADNPDVLEIPFKTNISLEPPCTTELQSDDWQLSEQKMQKAIHEDSQKDLALLNQEKIPGGVTKREGSHLKETKLLFEAFQQDNTGGPARHTKNPPSLTKGHMYPSVLERTRSLEMFSLKSCPVSRAHSLRLYRSSTSEREKCPDNLRCKSPTGGSWDKTRLSPYPKQDKHLRLCRSMDSINTDNPASGLEKTGKRQMGKGRQKSPILSQNPFFKLRPSLALQPEVEKDIREAKEREEELRRQRCALYGENWQSAEEGEMSPLSSTLRSAVKQQSRGKLERVWPPPSKNERIKAQQGQGSKVHRAGGQKAPLWQRWESGQINGQPSKEKH